MPRVRPRTRTSLIALALALAIAPALGAGKPLPKGDPVKGKAVFSKNCVICHNADGSGGKKLTANGNASRDFRDSSFWAGHTDEQVRAVINEGVPKSGMITWKGILKPQEIEDVIAYIKLFARKDDAKPEPAPEARPADSARR
ncbi:MAG: cytochrome c [Candidatus Eisenbacteria bacterium]